MKLRAIFNFVKFYYARELFYEVFYFEDQFSFMRSNLLGNNF